MDNIEKMLQDVKTLPASPALLPRLASLLNDINNTDIHEIVDIIIFDSALTAKLLQIANSAFFGNSAPITNVGEAINVLGYDVVFLLAAAITGENSMKVPPGTGLDAVLLWKHSVISAFGAQYVARVSKVDGNLAFTAGLLHDLGKIVFAGMHGKIYTAAFDPSKRGTMTLVEWEVDHYGFNHAQVGATLMKNWKLPPNLVGGIRYHHDLAHAGEHAPLAACICLGNALSHTLEKPVFMLDANNVDIAPALKIVNLTNDDLRNQWAGIRQKWEFVKTLCDLRKH